MQLFGKLANTGWMLFFIAIACRGEAIVPQKGLMLFNGRDLQGWTTWLVDAKREDPRGVFTVTNGWIRVSGEGLGYLATKQAFRDYELTVEFKWGERNWPWGDRVGKARDSGIFLHATGPDGNSHDGHGAFMAAIECNLFQGATGDILLIRGNAEDGTLIAPRITAEVAETRDKDGWFYWREGGAARKLERWGRLNWFGKDPDWEDQLDARGPADLEKPSGEWNEIKILSRDGLLRIWVNGALANEAREIWPVEGRILLQCEGSEIFFRRVELNPAPR